MPTTYNVKDLLTKKGIGDPMYYRSVDSLFYINETGCLVPRSGSFIAYRPGCGCPICAHYKDIYNRLRSR